VPDAWTRILVQAADPTLDGGGQVGHGAVGAAPQPFRRQFREPALDQVHPGTVGRGEVKREAGMTMEPALDFGGEVEGNVVQDDMHSEVVGHLLVDQVEEAAELAGTVSRSQVGDYVARGDVERGVQIGGPMSYVAVGLATRHAGHNGRVGPVRSSAWIWVFSSTQSTTATSGGFEVQTGHVAHLVDELRVGREPELLEQVRLEPEGAPDPGDCGLRHSHLSGHRVGRPVGRVAR